MERQCKNYQKILIHLFNLLNLLHSNNNIQKLYKMNVLTKIKNYYKRMTDYIKSKCSCGCCVCD